MSGRDPGGILSVENGLPAAMDDPIDIIPAYVDSGQRLGSRWTEPVAVGDLNHDGEINELFVTPGVIWAHPFAHPLDGWIGLGAPIGLNDRSDHQRFILQLVQEFDLR